MYMYINVVHTLEACFQLRPSANYRFVATRHPTEQVSSIAKPITDNTLLHDLGMLTIQAVSPVLPMRCGFTSQPANMIYLERRMEISIRSFAWCSLIRKPIPRAALCTTNRSFSAPLACALHPSRTLCCDLESEFCFAN